MKRRGIGGTNRFFITGCASGIGRQLAQELAAAGHRVYSTDLNANGLSRRLDVRDAGDWEAALDEAWAQLGGIDVLLNVAGCLVPGWVQDTSVEDVDLLIDVNLKGVIHGTRAGAKRMIAAGDGHIINIASLAGIAPVPGMSLYSASKFGVRGFSLSAAGELRAHGVAVSVICPDAVRTPMLARQRGHEEAALTFSGPHPLTVEEVSRVIGRCIRERGVEYALPRSRAFLARFAGLFPAFALRLVPHFRKKGRAHQLSES